MKRIISLFALASLAVLSLSCEKEIESPEPAKAELYTYSFEAFDADADKSIFDGSKITWKEGDEVGYFVSDFSGNSVIGSDQIFKISTTEPVSGETLYAYVPYVAGNASKTSVNITIPESQDSDNLVMPAFGSATVAADGVVPIKLSNLGSIVAFKLYSATGAYSDEKVTSIKMTSTTNAICGSFTKDITAASALEVSGYDKEAVTVTVNGDLTAASGRDNATVVYAVVAPGTYDGNIVVTTDAASYTYPFTNQTFQRSHSKGLVLNLEKEGVREELPYIQLDITDVEEIMGGSYATGSITNEYGVWNYNACKQVGHIQLRNNATVSYVQIPVVNGVITSLEFTGVCNGGGDAYTGTLYLRSENKNDGSELASLKCDGIEANSKVVLNVSEPCSTGYIMTSGAFRFTNVKVYYIPGPAKTLTSIVVSGEPSKTEYNDGDSFDPAGLVVTGTYDDATTSEITSGIDWTISPDPLTVGTTSVSVIATVGGLSSNAYTVTGLNVSAAPVTIDLNNTFYGINTGNNGTEQSKTTEAGITIVSGCKSNAASKTYYDSAHIRYYKDSYLKVSVDGTISKIKLIAGGTWNKEDIVVKVGNYDIDNNIWTGSESEVDFNFTAQCRVASIEVTYTLDTTPKYTVSCNEVDGGTLSASPSKAIAGTEITLTATPNEEYTFNNDWSVKGADNTTIDVSEGKFTLPEQNVTVSGSFTKKTYAITKNAAEHGTYTVTDKDGTAVTIASKGDKITLTAAPSDGYTLDHWEVMKPSGESVSVNNDAFYMPASAVSVSAYFVEAAAIPVYSSLAELVAAGTPPTTATKVTVTLTDEEITGIYMSGSYRNGIFLKSGEQEIEIYSRNVPNDWAVGGTVTGTLAECDWVLYGTTWELKPADWSKLTYTAPTSGGDGEDVTYTKITSLSDLETGDYVIVGAQKAAGLGELTYGTLNSGRIPYTQQYTSVPASITKQSDDGSIWHVTVSGTTVTLYNTKNKKYIADAGSGKLKYEASGMSFTAACANGVFSLASGTNFLCINASSDYWRNYASSTGYNKGVCLYFYKKN